MLFLFTIISALIELLVYGQYIVPQKGKYFIISFYPFLYKALSKPSHFFHKEILNL